MTQEATPSHSVETLVANQSISKTTLGVDGQYKDFNICHYSVVILAYAMAAPDIFSPDL